MRLAIALFICAFSLVVIYISLDATSVIQWAAEQQRWFQNQMASSVRALRAGNPGAYAALLSAAAAYGFVHAVGPGHGKFLIGGVGLGVQVSAPRLLSIAIISSLAQSVWAIILVYGGFYLLEVTGKQMTFLADNYLAPASYLAIAAIGIYLVWRGARSLARYLVPNPVAAATISQTSEVHLEHSHIDPANHNHEHSHNHHHHHGDHNHNHDHEECGCHSHGPSPEQVANLGSFRDSVVLIGSIAVRPCTSAIFLLVITWSMDILLPGVVAVLVMGLGTAMLTSLVAVSSVFARGMAFASAGKLGAVSMAKPVLEIIAGSLILWASILLLGYVI